MADGVDRELKCDIFRNTTDLLHNTKSLAFLLSQIQDSHTAHEFAIVGNSVGTYKVLPLTER